MPGLPRPVHSKLNIADKEEPMRNRNRTSGNNENRTRGNVVREPARSRTHVARSGGLQPYTRNYVDWPAGRELMSYPVDMLRRFRHDMDRFFEDFSTSVRTGDRQTLSVWTPRTEMLEREGNLVVRVELPGLQKDDVKVSVWNDHLVIEGERRQDEEMRGRGYYESEWRYGRFYREIPLPESVDADQVKAHFMNGVLEIELPQSESAKERREVPIHTS
jgi:HSP20 family protein